MENKRIMIYRDHYVSADMLKKKIVGDPIKLYVDYHEQSGRMTKEQIKIDLEKLSEAMSNKKYYWIGTYELSLLAEPMDILNTDDRVIFDGALQLLTCDTDHPMRSEILSSYMYALGPSEEYDIRYIDLYAGKPITNESIFDALLRITNDGHQPEPIKQFLFDSIDWVRINAEEWFSDEYPKLLKDEKLKEDTQHAFILECFNECYKMFKNKICSSYIPKALR